MDRKDINKKNVGKKIKQIRLSNGWTLIKFSDEISKIIGDKKQIAEGVISRWESGISLPNPKRLKAIAKIADITVEELIDVKKDYKNFKQLMLNQDSDLKQMLIKKIRELPYEDYSDHYKNFNESSKITELRYCILEIENRNKEIQDFNFSSVTDELVTQLMSPDFKQYWELAYILCYPDNPTASSVYIEEIFYDFMVEAFSKNEKYVIPMIKVVLSNTKDEIKKIISGIDSYNDNIFHDKTFGIINNNEIKSEVINRDTRIELFNKIDEAISIVSSLEK